MGYVSSIIVGEEIKPILMILNVSKPINTCSLPYDE